MHITNAFLLHAPVLLQAELFFGLGIAWLILGLIWLIVWIWALFDIIRRSFPSDVEKIVWLVLVTFMPVLGLAIYLVIGRPRTQRRHENLG